MADTADVTTYVLKQALAAQVADHIEIAVKAEDGTTFKIRSTAEQLDALVGDLELLLDADDTEAAERLRSRRVRRAGSTLAGGSRQAAGTPISSAWRPPR